MLTQHDQKTKSYYKPSFYVTIAQNSILDKERLIERLDLQIDETTRKYQVEIAFKPH